ncbi:restriction endonuclease [Pseudoxanthomonas suwonensis]|uniref:restriction endonuclease n=1 Tax=Pseudoxanthomonas suwonensis TaxID=314722 RepID=UPI0009E267E8|nr:restriction endonuclease [Pseudoxanthomonas suwonensis]
MPDLDASVPEFAQWVNPVLAALRELGGSGKPREVVELVADSEKVSDAVLDRINTNGGSRFTNQVHWARYFLAEDGYIDRSRRGVWALTEKASLTPVLSPSQVRLLVTEVQRRDREAREVNVTGEVLAGPAETSSISGELEALPPDAEHGDYRAKLMWVLRGLSPSGFERICQRLLRESGFEQVFVTGRSNDGGIDGHGLLSLNAFVSFRVLFQCKRYSGSVTPAQIRDFRGAMQGRADKGIILTTGTFTAEAKREASRDGAPPIELVDGDKLVELFAKLELGLRPVTTYEVQEAFFDDFR